MSAIATALSVASIQCLWRSRRAPTNSGAISNPWRTLGELQRLSGLLEQHGALVGASDHVTTKSLYAKDPDGIEFEVCWILPADVIDDALIERSKRVQTAPLDLPTEIERYGANRRGGVGVSIPV